MAMYLTAPECQAKYNVRPGDIYLVDGRHRVMCGDSQVPQQLNTLLQGVNVDAVITDPPYMTTTLRFDKSFKTNFINLLLFYVQRNGYLAMFSSVEMLAQAAKVWSLRFTGAWFKSGVYNRLPSAKMPACQTEIYGVYAHPHAEVSKLVWNNVYREGQPYQRIERGNDRREGLKDGRLLHLTLSGHYHNETGDRAVSDALWGRIKQTLPYSDRTDHPTQKPVEVMEVLVQWLTNPNGTILDPFLGSGSTLLAGHGHGRIVYGMDIEPAYVAVTLDRLQRNNIPFEKLT